MTDKMLNAADLKYSDIQVGSVYAFKRKIQEQDLMNFANLTGDFNPLHVDKDFGKRSRFKSNIAHGMLAASLFSTLVGMYCPGQRSLYLTQSIKFRRPVFAGDELLVRGTVINKIDSTRVIVLKTEIIVGAVVVVSGEAQVEIMGDN